MQRLRTHGKEPRRRSAQGAASRLASAATLAARASLPSLSRPHTHLQRREVVQVDEGPEPVVLEPELPEAAQAGKRLGVDVADAVAVEHELLQIDQPLEPVDARDVVVVEEEGAQRREAAQLQRGDAGDLVAAQLQRLRAQCTRAQCTRPPGSAGQARWRRRRDRAGRAARHLQAREEVDAAGRGRRAGRHVPLLPRGVAPGLVPAQMHAQTTQAALSVNSLWRR